MSDPTEDLARNTEVRPFTVQIPGRHWSRCERASQRRAGLPGSW